MGDAAGSSSADASPELGPADQIRNLIHRYAELLDDGDLAALEELFAHAVVTSAVAEGDWRGSAVSERRPEDVPELAIFRAAHLEGRPGTHHVTTNTIIELGPAGDSANARSCFTVFQARGTVPLQPVIAGRYHDRFAVIGGAWRFTGRHFFVDLVGVLDELLGAGHGLDRRPG